MPVPPGGIGVEQVPVPLPVFCRAPAGDIHGFAPPGVTTSFVSFSTRMPNGWSDGSSSVGGIRWYSGKASRISLGQVCGQGIGGVVGSNCEQPSDACETQYGPSHASTPQSVVIARRPCIEAYSASALNDTVAIFTLARARAVASPAPIGNPGTR